MCKIRPLLIMLAVTLLITQTGCWSSKEIEDLSVYTGLAMDKGEPTPEEQTFEEEGGGYFKNNKITATIEIVPKKSFGSASKTSESGNQPQYTNISETGDSLLEIFRQYTIRLDRPIIGHHLKVIIISSKLASENGLRQLMDFVLRDNDIRPSCLVFISKERAVDTLKSKYGDEVPSFHISDMIRNRFRSNKIMKPVNLSTIDALMHSKRSFVLQNILGGNGEVEFSGGGIIKGETGKWIGNLSQQDVESMGWIKGDVNGGVIKAYTQKHKSTTYEIKSVKSKIIPQIKNEGELSFHVDIQSEGRLIENWDPELNTTTVGSLKEREKLFEKRLNTMLTQFMQKMQSTYKVEVAGFGERLSIEEPKVWKKLKDHWDDAFSKVPVTFSIKLTITDYGSFNE